SRHTLKPQQLFAVLLDASNTPKKDGKSCCLSTATRAATHIATNITPTGQTAPASGIRPNYVTL
ncbi:MAG TPA: hypothetical protein VGH99_00725, partial [Pseudonocardia sp.]